MFARNVAGLLICAAICAAQPSTWKHTPFRLKQHAKHVVYLVGGGVGFDVARERVVAPGRAHRLAKIHPLSPPESSARATEIATGCEGRARAPGITAEGRPSVSVLDAARVAGRAVGLITTGCAIDATSASFLSHSENRYAYEEIGKLVSDEAHFPDLYVGGTSEHIQPPKEWRVKTSVEALREGGDRAVVYLKSKIKHSFFDLTCTYAPYARERAALSDMVDYGIRFLNQTTKGQTRGTFLLVDAARVDHAAHAGNRTRYEAELEDLRGTFEWLDAWQSSDAQRRWFTFVGDHATPFQEGRKGSRHDDMPVFSWTPSGPLPETFAHAHELVAGGASCKSAQPLRMTATDSKLRRARDNTFVFFGTIIVLFVVTGIFYACI